MRTDWNERLEKARGLKPLGLSVLTAFNSNIDAVKRIGVPSYQSFPLSFSKRELARVRDLSSKDYFPLGVVANRAEAFAALKWSVEHGEAALVSAKPGVIKWLEASVDSKGDFRLGGQASLIGENLMRLGCRTLVYPLMLSKELARLHSKRIAYPLPIESGVTTKPIRECTNSRFTKENLVLEYGRELSSRPNRVIYSSRLRQKVRFGREWSKARLRDLGGMLDACVFSGFHHLESERDLSAVTAQLEALKQGRGRFEFHCEYVPFKDKRIESRVLRKLSRTIDSLGLNEIELRELHKALFNKGFDISNPRSLLRAAERVYDSFDLERLHVHTLGLHLVVLSGKRDAKRAVDACLLASDEASFKAGGNNKERPRIKRAAIAKAKFACNEFKEKRGRYSIAVPATFVDKPVHTVGLGDIVSSTAFAAELAHA